jgi:hypothetical protein
MNSPPYHHCHYESIAIITIEKERGKKKEKEKKEKWKQSNKKHKTLIRHHCELKFPKPAKFSELVNFTKPKIKMVRGYNLDLPFHFYFYFFNL